MDCCRHRRLRRRRAALPMKGGPFRRCDRDRMKKKTRDTEKRDFFFAKTIEIRHLQRSFIATTANFHNDNDFTSAQRTGIFSFSSHRRIPLCQHTSDVFSCRHTFGSVSLRMCASASAGVFVYISIHSAIMHLIRSSSPVTMSNAIRKM